VQGLRPELMRSRQHAESGAVCPGRRAGTPRLACSVAALLATMSAGAGEASIGYPSVRAAFDAVRALPGIDVRQDAGWTLLQDRSGAHPVAWSFAPPAHPAYPAVIRRDFVMKRGLPTLATRLRCEGAQRACDRLYATLQRGESEAATNRPGRR